MPDDACVDSFDVMDALMGVPEAKGRTAIIQQDNNGTDFGYREGKWKLQRHDSGNTNNLDVSKKLTKTDVPLFQLFDLEKDPEERTDVSAENEDIVKGMKLRLDLIIKTGRHRP